MHLSTKDLPFSLAQIALISLLQTWSHQKSIPVAMKQVLWSIIRGTLHSTASSPQIHRAHQRLEDHRVPSPHRPLFVRIHANLLQNYYQCLK